MIDEVTGAYVYRASALGSCVVAQARARQGCTPMEAPEKFQEYFARGDRIEDEVKADLRERGWTISHEQLEVDLRIGSAVIVRGHIDGLGKNGTDFTLRHIEIKATNAQYFKQLEKLGWGTPGLMQKYKWQTSDYLIALRDQFHEPAMEGVLIFRNHEDDNALTNTLYFYYEQPHYSKAQIMGRVLGIEAMVKDDRVPMECDVYDYPCPFYYMHPPEDREDADADEVGEIEDAARAYRDAGAREREAKDAKSDASKRLRALLRDREKLTAGSVKVTQYTGSHQDFDDAAFKRDHPDIDLSRYRGSKPNANTSFRITDAGPTTDGGYDETSVGRLPDVPVSSGDGDDGGGEDTDRTATDAPTPPSAEVSDVRGDDGIPDDGAEVSLFGSEGRTNDTAPEVG